MILGIDLRNDYAFKRVFGSEQHTQVLIHVLNAVLEPPPGERVERVEILNPITEPLVMDDKLSVLDIRARDQRGRQFNVEMQMVPRVSEPNRFLYYWARLYGNQLQSGQEYYTLAPVISICFLDGVLFPGTDAYHLPFRLWEPKSQLTLTDQLAIHVFQLPKFTKTAQELVEPLDAWLYFLNNSRELDTERLPEPLRLREVEEAVRILTVLTQDELERERYFDREKARRDALFLEAWKQRGFAEVHDKALAEGLAKGLAKGLAEGLAEGRSEGRSEGLIGQIRLCERFLKLEPLPEDDLNAMSLDELHRVLEGMETNLPE